MFAKRSHMIANIKDKVSKITDLSESDQQLASIQILALVEMFMEPKLRPLTKNEVEDHVLVKQVHESRKEEVRNYVRNLEYEQKREWIPEDT